MDSLPPRPEEPSSWAGTDTQTAGSLRPAPQTAQQGQWRWRQRGHHSVTHRITCRWSWWPQAGTGGRVWMQGLNCKKIHKNEQSTLSPGDWLSREQSGKFIRQASDIYIINTEQGNMRKTLFKNKKPTKKKNLGRKCTALKENLRYCGGASCGPGARLGGWTPIAGAVCAETRYPPPQGRRKETSDLHNRRLLKLCPVWVWDLWLEEGCGFRNWNLSSNGINKSSQWHSDISSQSIII